MIFLTNSLPGNLSIKSTTKSSTWNEYWIRYTETRKNTKSTRVPGHDKPKASKIPKTANDDTNNTILSSQGHNNWKSSDHNFTDEERRRPGEWVSNKLNSNLKITKVLKNYYHRQHHDHCLIKSCRPLVKGHSTTPNHSTILHLSNSFPKSSLVNHHWPTSSQRYLKKSFSLKCASRVKQRRKRKWKYFSISCNFVSTQILSKYKEHLQNIWI